MLSDQPVVHAGTRALYVVCTELLASRGAPHFVHMAPMGNGIA
jgi:hypothetical protein